MEGGFELMEIWAKDPNETDGSDQIYAVARVKNLD